VSRLTVRLSQALASRRRLTIDLRLSFKANVSISLTTHQRLVRRWRIGGRDGNQSLRLPLTHPLSTGLYSLTALAVTSAGKRAHTQLRLRVR
jgi:hypothetical protein